MSSPQTTLSPDWSHRARPPIIARFGSGGHRVSATSLSAFVAAPPGDAVAVPKEIAVGGPPANEQSQAASPIPLVASRATQVAELPRVTAPPRIAILSLAESSILDCAAITCALAEQLMQKFGCGNAFASIEQRDFKLARGRAFRGSRLDVDGFKLRARRGDVSIIDADDLDAAIVAASGCAPLVAAITADSSLRQMLQRLHPAAIIVIADDRASASYLQLVSGDLQAEFTGAKVLTGRIGDLPDPSARSQDELPLTRDPSVAFKLRFGLPFANDTQANVALIADAFEIAQ